MPLEGLGIAAAEQRPGSLWAGLQTANNSQTGASAFNTGQIFPQCCAAFEQKVRGNGSRKNLEVFKSVASFGAIACYL